MSTVEVLGNVAGIGAGEGGFRKERGGRVKG